MPSNTECPCCGAELLTRHCKLACPVCPYTEDCGETVLTVPPPTPPDETSEPDDFQGSAY